MFNGKVLSGKALRTVGLYAPIQEILRSIVSVGDYPSFQILIERV
jgi:hypothetical protein